MYVHVITQNEKENGSCVQGTELEYTIKTIIRNLPTSLIFGMMGFKQAVYHECSSLSLIWLSGFL